MMPAPDRPASTPPPAAPTRTLVPHEHGAYGQLLMPLVTALAVTRLTAPALWLALALVLAFLAHESLLVVVGQRGKRALETDGPRAARLLGWLGGAAVASAAVGLAFAPAAARWAFLASAALGVAVGWLVLRRLEKTLGGEVLVAAALASGGLTVALAGGAAVTVAVACWVTWVLAFGAATLAVQVVLVRARSKGQRDPGPAHAAVAIALLACAFAAVPLLGFPRAAAVALVPTGGLSVAVCLAHFSPKRLRELGWAMVGSSVLTMIILVVGLR